MNGPDEKPIVAVEWCKHNDGVWRVNVVYTSRSSYDFVYCHADGQTLYCDVGSGIDRFTVAHVSPCFRVWSTVPFVDVDGNVITELQTAERGYEVVRELEVNPFDDADVGDTAWCCVCKSHVDTEDTCRHIHQCYDGNGYCWGSGANDLDLEETRRSLFRIFRVMPHAAIDALKSTILSPSFTGAGRTDSLLGGDCQFHFSSDGGYLNLYWENLGSEPAFDDRILPGMCWLFSLDDKTRDQIMLTAGWIWQFKAGHRDDSALAFYVEVSQDKLRPLLECPFDSVPDKIELDAASALSSRCLNTTQFVDRKFAETVILRSGNAMVEATVGKAWIDSKTVTIELGHIVHKRIEHNEFDIIDENPKMLATYWSSPTPPKKKRKTRAKV